MMEEWIIEKISQKKNISREDIIKIINERSKQFPELSEDAILRMLATENGIIPIKRDYKIKEITERINHLNVSGKIKRKFQPRKVTVKGREARVMNFTIEDNTGEISVTTWDESYIDKVLNTKEGDEISIANAYSKENPFTGNIEINLGKGSAIAVNPAQEKKDLTKSKNFKKINELKDGESAFINGFITRLFYDNIYLIRCSICNKKVDVECDIHKDKALLKTLMIRGIFDDGLSSSSVTFFDKEANSLLKLSEKQETKEKLEDLSFGLYQVELLAKLNKFNDNYSLTAKSISRVKYEL